MSRKGSTPQRTVLPDPKHGSETIARFINMVMQSGKKSVAEKIVYGAMDVIGEKNPNALELSALLSGGHLGCRGCHVFVRPRINLRSAGLRVPA